MSLKPALDRLTCACVRDLAWALLAPPLINSRALPLRSPLHGSRWLREPDTLLHWLYALDAQPAPLMHWLAEKPTSRLGVYYERLWQFALHHAPDIHLLAANLALREGPRTLGEMDLLLQQQESVVHLELAIKFYLGLPSDSDVQWIGPGGKDRFDLKLARLRNHQLPLASSPEGQTALRAYSEQTPSSHAWLGGYLFYPWPDSCSPPSSAGALHARGLWLHQWQWPAFSRTRPNARWQLLPRLSWLAPARVPAEHALTGEQLTIQLGLEPLKPHLVAQLNIDATGIAHEFERVFIVPNQWPNA